MLNDSDQDLLYMQLALELAERGRGAVEPNPMVGAVIVRDGEIKGEGWHEQFGGPHAEVHALEAAGASARGATLYVTLEPCCHHGKTPPCTDALLKAGIARVVAAMQDPFPKVSGYGAEILQNAGVAVELGVGETPARRLNAPYLKLLQQGVPFVHAKWAMTLDGKIATVTGDSKWISGEASRKWVHALRGRMDAILVGGRTARVDDPLLTARPPGPRVATRIILSETGRVLPAERLVATAREYPTLIVTAGAIPEKLVEAGCEVLPIRAGDLATRIQLLLQELGRRRMTNLLVEGGGQILGGFLDARAIDEAHVFLAPVMLGGAGALSPLGGKGVDKIADGLRLKSWRYEAIGEDLLIHGQIS